MPYSRPGDFPYGYALRAGMFGKVGLLSTFKNNSDYSVLVEWKKVYMLGRLTCYALGANNMR